MAQSHDGVFTWIHADHLSSATRITDAAGLEIRRLAYASFGEEADNQGTGDKPKYTYTGKEHDATGLYYYGARYYDPALSRFISADTVYDVGPQGLNRYSYALNNPIIYRDPTGHSTGIDPETGRIDPPVVKDTEWVDRPGSRSPEYRWYEKDITAEELQTYGIPCREVAKFHGVKVNPGYGHVEEWYTTEDGCAACYYRPAEWWEPGLKT